MKPARALLLFLVFCFASPARAVVLRALVTQVPDGKTVVVTVGTNRKLTVVFAGLDAPELRQEYGDVAQKHLAQLILNKEVEVEFTQMDLGNVVGKVYCNRIDVGLQVIRDGVAWYDKSNDHDLTELERRLYNEAQQAARVEQRGLWHDGTPMPPWEWRRAQTAKFSQPNSTVPGASTRSLSSEDVVAARRSVVRSNNNANTGSKAAGSTAKRVAKPPSKALNKPGEDSDFSSYLNQGRISVVYFYADWCPTCRGLTPVMAAINARVPDMQVLFMNIGEWNTPVTQRYGITYVPYLRIYDRSGYLVAEGHAANSWLQQAFSGGGN